MYLAAMEEVVAKEKAAFLRSLEIFFFFFFLQKNKVITKALMVEAYRLCIGLKKA